jgi:chitinase
MSNTTPDPEPVIVTVDDQYDVIVPQTEYFERGGKPAVVETKDR